MERIFKKNSLIVGFFFLGSTFFYKKLLPSMVKQWASFNCMRKINISNPAYGIFLLDFLLSNFSSVNRILYQKYCLIMVLLLFPL